VDLWFARLSELEVSLEPILSPEERRRAFCFRFTRDTVDFIARHGILRLILASYTGLAPAMLSFTYNRFGKPALDGCAFNPRFNMSRSGDLAVYAVARHRDVGVDIESLQQPGLDISSIAALLYSEEEIAALNDIPAHAREEAFLRIWTRLEAQGKARGIGIGNLRSDVDSFDGRFFGYAQRRPSPGYVLALVVQGRHRCRVRMTEFQLPMWNSRYIVQART